MLTSHEIPRSVQDICAYTLVIASAHVRRYMLEAERKRGAKVGFLDPYVVTANNIIANEAFVLDYVVNALLVYKEQDMEAVCFPYNQRYVRLSVLAASVVACLLAPG